MTRRRTESTVAMHWLDNLDAIVEAMIQWDDELFDNDG